MRHHGLAKTRDAIDMGDVVDKRMGVTNTQTNCALSTQMNGALSTQMNGVMIKATDPACWE